MHGTLAPGALQHVTLGVVRSLTLWPAHNGPLHGMQLLPPEGVTELQELQLHRDANLMKARFQCRQ
jgi:hypothetical protein